MCVNFWTKVNPFSQIVYTSGLKYDWKGHNSGPRASPDIIPKPFDVKKLEVTVLTRIRAWNGLDTMQIHLKKSRPQGNIVKMGNRDFPSAIFEKYP